MNEVFWDLRVRRVNWVVFLVLMVVFWVLFRKELRESWVFEDFWVYMDGWGIRERLVFLDGWVVLG